MNINDMSFEEIEALKQSIMNAIDIRVGTESLHVVE